MTDKYTPEIIRDIEAAHMAGQSDAGVDPSYSNAQAYVKELQKPAYVPKVGEVYAYLAGCTYLIHNEGSNTGKSARPLTQSECGPVGEALGVAIEALESLSETEWMDSDSVEQWKNESLRVTGEADKTLSEITRLMEVCDA